jgi:hypothetical protein
LQELFEVFLVQASRCNALVGSVGVKLLVASVEVAAKRRSDQHLSDYQVFDLFKAVQNLSQLLLFLQFDLLVDAISEVIPDHCTV